MAADLMMTKRLGFVAALASAVVLGFGAAASAQQGDLQPETPPERFQVPPSPVADVAEAVPQPAEDGRPGWMKLYARMTGKEKRQPNDYRSRSVGDRRP